MKRSKLLAGACLAGALAVQIGAAASVSARVVQNERHETGEFAVNLCNGEGVVLSGTSHVVVREVPDGFEVKVNAHLTGTGSQGNEYVLSSRQQGTYPTETLTARMLLVSKGSAPNQLLVSTFTASGPPTFSSECRG